MNPIVNIFSILTFATHIVLLAYLLLLIFARKSRLKKEVDKFLTNDALLLILIVSVAGTLGSLYFSEIAGFDPCVLCWYQRTMFYPLMIIGIVALARKAYDAAKYLLPLTIVGAVISAYHNIVVFVGRSALCLPGRESCVSQPFLFLGYISIPMMALTGFVIVGLLSLFIMRKKK